MILPSKRPNLLTAFLLGCAIVTCTPIFCMKFVMWTKSRISEFGLGVWSARPEERKEIMIKYATKDKSFMTDNMIKLKIKSVENVETY